MIRLARYIYTNMRDGWRWFRRADREEKIEAWIRYWPPFH
jgi:hypothetical protein